MDVSFHFISLSNHRSLAGGKNCSENFFSFLFSEDNLFIYFLLARSRFYGLDATFDSFFLQFLVNVEF